ncbi:MAG: hypothetical protein HY925_05710 [Elusimicrobia bacterium]|nr:hypothetical protein [Elusimicrobiota bacterium]
MGRVLKATKLGLEAASVLLLGEELNKRGPKRNHRAPTARATTRRRTSRKAIHRSQRSTRRIRRKAVQTARRMGRKEGREISPV